MKLDYKRTFLLGFGFFGISIAWSVYNAFVPIFLRDYQLPWFLVGFVMTLDNILAITLLPYIGQLSDRTRSRLGRRMPYILLGTPIAALFLAIIPTLHLNLPHISSTFWLMTTAIVVMNVAMAIFRTPTVALMPDITPSPLRSKANGIINLMGGVGTSIAFLIGGMLFARAQSAPFILAAVVLLVAEAVVLLTIREPQVDAASAAVDGGKAQRLNLWQSLRSTLADVAGIAHQRDKSALFICLAIFCWFMGYNAIETFWTSYGKEVLYAGQITAGTLTADQAVARSASMLTYLSAAFLVFALPAGFIATRFGRKPTILLGLGVLFVLWAGMRFTTSSTYVMVALVLSGIAWASININSLPIVADLAPAGKIGAYTGIYYFFSMLAASTSPTIVGWLMDLAGVRVMFVFTPVFMLLAFLCMLAVRRSEPVAAPTARKAVADA